MGFWWGFEVALLLSLGLKVFVFNLIIIRQKVLEGLAHEIALQSLGNVRARCRLAPRRNVGESQRLHILPEHEIRIRIHGTIWHHLQHLTREDPKVTCPRGILSPLQVVGPLLFETQRQLQGNQET